MDGTKKVLVRLHNYNRVVAVDGRSCSEREVLISLICETFSDQIEDNDAVILQIKDEEWGGHQHLWTISKIKFLTKASLGLSWRSLRLVSVQIYEYGLVVGEGTLYSEAVRQMEMHMSL